MRDGRAWRLTHIENPDGLRVRLHFADGRLAGLTDPAGRRVQATTDGKGRITELSFVTEKETRPWCRTPTTKRET